MKPARRRALMMGGSLLVVLSIAFAAVMAFLARRDSRRVWAEMEEVSARWREHRERRYPRPALRGDALPGIAWNYYGRAIGAWTDLVALAVAARHYTIDYGAPPSRIEDLQPLLREVPTSPYPGQPYALTRVGDSVTFSAGRKDARGDALELSLKLEER